MCKRPFLEKANQPTDETLQSVLGSAYTYYERALNRASSYLQTWTFTKSSGWMLKVHARKKALFYLIPLQESLKITLTLRENEREAFLQDDDLTAMHDAILSSRKYREDFALQFDIVDAAAFQSFEQFIRKLITARG